LNQTNKYLPTLVLNQTNKPPHPYCWDYPCFLFDFSYSVRYTRFLFLHETALSLTYSIIEIFLLYANTRPICLSLPLSIVHEINEFAKSSHIDRDAAIQGCLSRYFIPYLRQRKVERFLRSCMPRLMIFSP
jgi:hypothetical protein